jgi:hypothetical protein
MGLRLSRNGGGDEGRFETGKGCVWRVRVMGIGKERGGEEQRHWKGGAVLDQPHRLILSLAPPTNQSIVA